MARAHPSGSSARTSTAAVVALAIAIGLAGAACGTGPAEPGSDRPTVVATTGIWGDVVARVACDGSIDVGVMIPDGSDPHGFEPSLADRARLDDARLIVANGLFLEEGLLDAIDAAEADGTPVFRIGDHVDTLAYHSTEIGSDEPAGDHGAGDHEHGGIDPHIWFDPTRVAGALPALADALVDDAGLDRAVADGCVDAYRAELAELDRTIDDLVDAVPAESRLLVTSHDALGYFADRYGFEILATVSPSPSGMAETGPARLEALVEAMDEAGVRVVFADAQSSSADADALARSVDGAVVVPLATGALGGPGGAETYVDLVLRVAESITAALPS